MFSIELTGKAARLLEHCAAHAYRIATAESCTGGLVAGLLTEIPGSSASFERGFVTYSNEAKAELLGVPAELIGQFGAVSREVAIAMAEGALRLTAVDVAVAITGVAGPGGGSENKPVGLVHIAALHRGQKAVHSELRFGDIGRGPIRVASVEAAIDLLSIVAGLQVAGRA